MKIEEAINQKEFSSSYQKALINLKYTNNWLKEEGKATLEPYKITQQQYNVLRILRGAYPKVLSAGEIKKVMIDKSPDLTRLIDRLVLKNWVDRELCSENRRKVEIKINENGLEMLKKMDVAIKDSEKIMHALSPEEANILSDLLDKLRG